MRTFIFAALAVMTLATTLPAEAKPGNGNGKHHGKHRGHVQRVYVPVRTQRVYVPTRTIVVQQRPVVIIQPVQRPTVTLTF